MRLLVSKKSNALPHLSFRKPKLLIAAILPAAFLLFGCSLASSEKLEDHLPIYQGWCRYQIELGQSRESIDSCVKTYWNEGSNLHDDFADLDEMHQYIAFESAVRWYCDKEGLEFNYCKTFISVSSLASEVLEAAPFDTRRSWSSGNQETYIIDGQVYNDPYGIDYQNGPNDVYGDGR
jgi:hypothetical protein